MTWLSRSAASWLSRGEVDQPGGVPCGAVDLAWGGFAAGAGVGQVVDGERAPADPGLAEYIPFVVGEQPGQVGEQDVGGAEQHRVVEGVVVVEGTGTTQVEL